MNKTIIFGALIAILSGLKFIVPVQFHELIDALIGLCGGGAVVSARMAISKASKGQQV